MRLKNSSILLFFLFIFSGFVTQTWTRYDNFEGRFSILSPGEFTAAVDTIETDIGKIDYHVFYYQEPDKEADNLFYMVSYCDYPSETVHSDSVHVLDEFFKTTIQTAASSVDGELMYVDETEFNEFPGRKWRINYLGGQAVIKTRAYLVGQRYYAMQTIALREKSLNNESEEFLNSFKLVVNKPEEND